MKKLNIIIILCSLFIVNGCGGSGESKTDERVPEAWEVNYVSEFDKSEYSTNYEEKLGMLHMVEGKITNIDKTETYIIYKIEDKEKNIWNFYATMGRLNREFSVGDDAIFFGMIDKRTEKQEANDEMYCGILRIIFDKRVYNSEIDNDPIAIEYERMTYGDRHYMLTGDTLVAITSLDGFDDLKNLVNSITSQLYLEKSQYHAEAKFRFKSMEIKNYKAYIDFYDTEDKIRLTMWVYLQDNTVDYLSIRHFGTKSASGYEAVKLNLPFIEEIPLSATERLDVLSKMVPMSGTGAYTYNYEHVALVTSPVGITYMRTSN